MSVLSNLLMSLSYTPGEACVPEIMREAAQRIAVLEAEVARLTAAIKEHREHANEVVSAHAEMSRTAYARGATAMRERAAAVVDCGCAARPDVMARLAKGLRARDACPYGNCSAEDAAAIRALPVEEAP